MDLCRMLGEPTPAEADPFGEVYCFERGARKDSGGDGWADVWKRRHFAWEYKSPGKSLDAAFDQLRQYLPALENPPLLIVCDLQRFRIRTNWTNSVSETHEFGLESLADPAKRDLLKWAFSDPDRLQPGVTRHSLTESAAASFAQVAQALRERGHDPQDVARFVNRMVFCMFADDVGLLPGQMFTKMLHHARRKPGDFSELAGDLFEAMTVGGRVGFEEVAWFNGGLFDDSAALPLERSDIDVVLKAAALDWSEIDPSILGTLFERGLDPAKRAQLGAHYTDRDKIMQLITPTVVEPLLAEWEVEKTAIQDDLDRSGASRSRSAKSRLRSTAKERMAAFLARLRAFTVLDPACGSGNFLYLALHALKDLEHRIQLEAEALGLERSFPEIGPTNVKGIEVNAYAAELARVSIWIGEIQWMRRNGFAEARNPILKHLHTIDCRDAILEPGGEEAAWPEADVVIGNPPFLGGKLLITHLGEEYVSQLLRAYSGRVPAEADLVCYWFEKAGRQIESLQTTRAGLVATNSIRGGANRRALQAATTGHRIFDAWSDEEWVVDGAAVRVSLVCFSSPGDRFAAGCRLDGEPVNEIHHDLTAGIDFTGVGRLAINAGAAFMGDTKGGAFDVASDQAREWLTAPNPNARPNTEVLKPWMNGRDVTRRPAGKWIVDFGSTMSAGDAALYEAPYEWVKEHVFPKRQTNRRKNYRDYWWRHAEPRQGMWNAIGNMSRYIATPTVAKHRLFVWCDARVCPDHQLIVIARDDDTTFGILHSRFHEAWSLRLCTWLGQGNDPRYTPTTTFETFPFPDGLSPDVPASAYAADPRAAAIADAASKLVTARDMWLNPPALVEWVDEPAGDYPQRPIPRDNHADKLKERTLTNLYNKRPDWLAQAHQTLDAAVAVAYGWPPDIPEEEALRRLKQLNNEAEGSANQNPKAQGT